MSAREWKPGDVALVNGHPCIRLAEGEWEHGKPLAFRYADHEGLDVRPLVVIDPEDREQVERLLMGYADWVDSDERPSDYPQYIDLMQAALREFANPTPTKPEEPTGLGAVVEDRKGVRWVRVGEIGERGVDDWKYAGTLRSGDNDWTTYADIDAVTVLSEGVAS